MDWLRSWVIATALCVCAVALVVLAATELTRVLAAGLGGSLVTLSLRRKD